MPKRIKITVEGEEFSGELNDSGTAAAVAKRLPLKIRMSRWGDEYYGSIGPSLKAAPTKDQREDMEVGELAFWIPGNALCIFFGPTPASSGPKPKAASPVIPIGKIAGALEKLKGFGSSITVEVTLGEVR